MILLTDLLWNMVKNMELPSNDGVHKLHVVVWQPDGAPKAVLQLSHGMLS